MVTNIAVAGGWELVLMLIIPATICGGLLFAAYLLVRLATRPRRLPVEEERP